ncbi:golgi uridine diphosphate-N- acetylglucosamine transporter, partial [Tilletia horrida]
RIATLFTQQSSSSASTTSTSNGEALNPTNYRFGVSLLILALVLSGLMGLYQERTFRIYGRDNWQEAFFYSHVLSLPIFLLRWRSLAKEIPDRAILDRLALTPPQRHQGRLKKRITRNLDGERPRSRKRQKLFRRSTSSWTVSSSAGAYSLTVPSFWPVLLLNALTHLLCINGVNQLTTQVTSLTVTVVLVISKALSLAIGVV